jgi:hypothetical protein
VLYYSASAILPASVGIFEMAIPLLRAKGKSGSWFAEIQGELPEGIQRRLPCVHNEWRSGLQFDDEHAPLDNPKWGEFLAALERGQVIETGDTVPEHRLGGWKRIKYIAVWEISPVEVAEGHLRFRFLKRLVHLK